MFSTQDLRLKLVNDTLSFSHETGDSCTFILSCFPCTIIMFMSTFSLNVKLLLRDTFEKYHMRIAYILIIFSVIHSS